MERVDGIIINKDKSIKDALKMLNSSELLILLVLDNEGRLERTITDGDIRRLLLDEGSLDRCISDIPHKEPIVVLEGIHIKDVLALMYSHAVNQIPVVNEFGHPLGLHVRKNIDTRILLSTPHLTGEEQKYVKQLEKNKLLHWYILSDLEKGVVKYNGWMKGEKIISSIPKKTKISKI